MNCFNWEAEASASCRLRHSPRRAKMELRTSCDLTDDRRPTSRKSIQVTRSYLQILWMSVQSGGAFFHSVGAFDAGDHICDER